MARESGKGIGVAWGDVLWGMRYPVCLQAGLALGYKD